MKYRHYRHECSYRVEVRTPEGRLPGWIVNVSASGARIEGLDEQRPGTRVQLSINGFLHGARIVWCRAPLCGLRFDRDLGKTELERIRERQPGQTGPMRRMQGAGHHGFREL